MRIAILANVPVWTLPGLDHLKHDKHYSTWLEPLVPAFAAHEDLEIHWITMCKETDRDLLHQAHGQSFHILHRGSKAIQMATGYIGEIRRIRKVLNTVQPDLIHAWGSEDVYGLAAAFSGHERRLFTLQGCLTEYLRLLGGSALFRLQAIYERPTIKRFKHATAESPAAADLLREIDPSLDINLVEYGIGPSFFDAKWNPSPEPQALFLGTINQRKGISDLIKTASRPSVAHIKFRIAGDGELREELETVSTPNVEWLGKCDRASVIRELEAAWCLVMPTYADTGPTVLKEARVIGLPVITTTGAGARSYIDRSGCGVVIQPGDLAALEAAILKVCETRDTCIEIGRSGWEADREELHPNATAEKFVNIYQMMNGEIAENSPSI